MTKEQLGRRIRDLRTRAGISQEAAAKHAGISALGWHRWESGAYQPQAIRIPKIAAAINVPVAALFADPDVRIIADLAVTVAALERVRVLGDAELQTLTQRLTDALTPAIATAADTLTLRAEPIPRARPTRRPPKRRSKRRQAGLASE